MKLTKAIWTLGLVAPATIIPLTTATSCSQVWGYKTPISIGTNIKGSALDPYVEFKNDTALFDLNGNLIVPQLQSNFAVDMARGSYYGYSLPEKWNSNSKWTETVGTGDTIEWNGKFEEGTAAWHTYSSDAFVTAITKTGVRDKSGTKTNVSEVVNSYRNNMLGMNIELTALIGTTINQFMNYALTYQGTQIGTKHEGQTETTSNLGISWGGNLTHGDIASEQNRKFFESIFATSAVSGTGKTQAACRPTHVEFKYLDMPIPSYTYSGGKVTGVSTYTKTLLNGVDEIPSGTGSASKPSYWSSRSDVQTESFTNLRTGLKEEYKYRVYTYTNVPVRVKFTGFAKSYVNPTINSGYQVSDFYSSDDTIKNTIGGSWAGSLSKFADDNKPATKDKPSASSFQFKAPESGWLKLNPVKSADHIDARILNNGECKLQQNDFVVLLNYAYKEYTEGKIGDKTATGSELRALDRVTMTGLSTVFPAYICDSNVTIDEKNFFKVANTVTEGDNHPGYTFDNGVINNWDSALLGIIKRSSSEGMKTYASQLSDKSKQLMKFLLYMFGTNNSGTLEADAANFIDVTPIKSE